MCSSDLGAARGVVAEEPSARASAHWGPWALPGGLLLLRPLACERSEDLRKLLLACHGFIFAASDLGAFVKFGLHPIFQGRETHSKDLDLHPRGSLRRAYGNSQIGINESRPVRKKRGFIQKQKNTLSLGGITV